VAQFKKRIPSAAKAGMKHAALRRGLNRLLKKAGSYQDIALAISQDQ